MEQRSFSDHSFNQFLDERQLMGSRCIDCQSVFVPPRPLCSKCNSFNMEWQTMEGVGRLVAFTSISIGPPSMVQQGYGRDNPYCTGVVELKEKTRVVARLKGVDSLNPDTIKVGLPVKVEFLKEGSDSNVHTILGFSPIEG